MKKLTLIGLLFLTGCFGGGGAIDQKIIKGEKDPTVTVSGLICEYPYREPAPKYVLFFRVKIGNARYATTLAKEGWDNVFVSPGKVKMEIDSKMKKGELIIGGDFWTIDGVMNRSWKSATLHVSDQEEKEWWDKHLTEVADLYLKWTNGGRYPP